MTQASPWLPNLILIADADGEWGRYCEMVYGRFVQDFLSSQPTFMGKHIRCRRDPIYDNKEAGFWHCVSEGRDELTRTPDFRRCERIGWARAVIENASDPKVDVWIRRNGGENRIHFWYNEEYLVVLGERGRTYQLITAFCTEYGHSIRNRRKERAANQRLMPPF